MYMCMISAKLNSVLEEVRNVLGEAVPEGVMVDTIMKHNFSVEGSLNELLNQQGTYIYMATALSLSLKASNKCNIFKAVWS